MAENQDTGSGQTNQGVIVAALVGVNILCLAAAAGATLLLSKPAAATAVTAEKTSVAKADGAKADGAKAEGAKADEPKEEAKAADAKPADAKDAPSAVPSCSIAAAAAAAAGGKAVVNIPGGRTKASMRRNADTTSALVLMLPAGTPVEIINKQTINNQVWYQVRTVSFEPPGAGWMHSNVLKLE